MDAADRLSGNGENSFQLGPEWTQVYVIWRTGAIETIKTNWTDLAHDDRLYQTILRKLIGFVSKKLGMPSLGARGSGSLSINEAEIQRRLTGKAGQRPFDDIDAHMAPGLPTGARAAIVSEQTDGELALEFLKELREDGSFQSVAANIDEAINVPSGARAPSVAADMGEGKKVLKRLDDSIQ
ncbi:MAG: hypothetical protein E5V74_03110, partial [Mesorhizobium sp.]